MQILTGAARDGVNVVTLKLIARGNWTIMGVIGYQIGRKKGELDLVENGQGKSLNISTLSMWAWQTGGVRALAGAGSETCGGAGWAWQKGRVRTGSGTCGGAELRQGRGGSGGACGHGRRAGIGTCGGAGSAWQPGGVRALLGAGSGTCGGAGWA